MGCAFGNICFQRTRGHSVCKVSQYDGKSTCHCLEESNECAYNRTMPFTKGGVWSVCRKSEDEYRDESNWVMWFLALVQDIFSSYAQMLFGSFHGQTSAAHLNEMK